MNVHEPNFGLFISPQHMRSQYGTIPCLDGLRAVSILLVLAGHFINSHVFPAGLGVYIFFVISGFLIARLLLAEQDKFGTISLPLFYMRRIIRLFPVIVTFVMVVIGTSLILGRPFNLIEPASALAYFANYLYPYLQSHGIQEQMPFGPFWSLSVEEHFYILFPPLLLLLRGNPGRLLKALLLVCLVCLVLRVAVAIRHPEYLSTLTFYVQTQYRMDSIAFGVMLAVACQIPSGRRVLTNLSHPAIAAGAVLAILACLVLRNPFFRETLRYTVLGCAINVLLAGILFGAGLRPLQWLLNIALLAWIGRLSYSLYVWHEGVASFLPLAGRPLWQSAAMALSASFVVATASYYLIERPSLRLRRYLQDTRVPLVVAPSCLKGVRVQTQQSLVPVGKTVDARIPAETP